MTCQINIYLPAFALGTNEKLTQSRPIVHHKIMIMRIIIIIKKTPNQRFLKWKKQKKKRKIFLKKRILLGKMCYKCSWKLYLLCSWMVGHVQEKSYLGRCIGDPGQGAHIPRNWTRGLQALSVQFRFAFSKPSSPQTRFLNRTVAASAEVAHFGRYKKKYFRPICVLKGGY